MRLRVLQAPGQAICSDQTSQPDMPSKNLAKAKTSKCIF